MVRRAIFSLAIIGVLVGFACDTPEAPQSGSSSSFSSSLPKEKIPPTSQEDSTKNANEAIDSWMKLVDQGQYASAWDQTGAWLKQAAPKDAWVKQITAIRNAYGALISRKVKSTEYKTNVPRMPPGVYVNITYDSSFANVKDAYEEVGATYENGKWQPLGYYVGSKAAAHTK
jgi:hypothetical protein